MLRAGSGYSAGKNLGSFRKILSQSGDVFVIDNFYLLGAERANLLLVGTEGFLLCFLGIFGLYFLIQRDNLLFRLLQLERQFVVGGKVLERGLAGRTVIREFGRAAFPWNRIA